MTATGIHDWFETSMGQALLGQEQVRCRELLPTGYYPRALQVGLPESNYLADIEVKDRFYIGARTMGPGRADGMHCAISRSSAMPYADRTHNLIVLPHTLDFCSDPHAVLREVSHILVPEGCVVITGFNQLSLWGGIRLAMKGFERAPWNGQFYRVGRVQDWLSLLGFELVGAGMMLYQPPLQNEKWRDKLSFVENAGDRWWPAMGAVYVIVSRKKEIAYSHPGARRLPWSRLLPGIAQPAAQRAARVGLKLVKNER